MALFEKAIHDICHLHRIITSEYQGHALLIGDAGTGRRTLTKLAAQLAGYEVVEMDGTMTASKDVFLENLKSMFERCGGKEGVKVIMLMVMGEGANESVVNVVDEIVTTGNVENLFGEQDFAAILDSMRTLWREQVSFGGLVIL